MGPGAPELAQPAERSQAYETVSVGWLDSDGAVSVREFEIPAGDRHARELVEESVALRNERIAGQRAVADAVVSGLTFGLSDRVDEQMQAAREANDLARQGRHRDFAQHFAQQHGLYLVPGGVAIHAGQEVVSMVQGLAGLGVAAMGWISDETGSLFAARSGGLIDPRRMHESRADTLEGRARQDAARGQRRSLPLQVTAGAVAGGPTRGAIRGMIGGGMIPPRGATRTPSRTSGPRGPRGPAAADPAAAGSPAAGPPRGAGPPPGGSRGGPSGHGPARGAPPRFFVTAEGVMIDRLSVNPSISAQRQGRHVRGAPQYRDGSYFTSASDAQRVLDAFHSGAAEVLGTTSRNHIVVRVRSVTGYNVNRRAGFLNQATNIFLIKGTRSPSVVPHNPAWKS